MRRTRLGRTGLEVSVIGFGGIPIQGVDAAEAERVVHAALDEGITLFDSARVYTDSEEKLGRALRGHRREVVLATKSMARDQAGMAREIETSLKALCTDCIDLYQVHNPGSDEQLAQVLGPGGALEALRAAQAQGKVRFLGLTGHARPLLAKAMGGGQFDTVQLPFSPLESEARGDVLPAARAVGAGVLAMKPLAGGALGKLPTAALRRGLEFGVDAVLAGMDGVEQVRENAAAGRAEGPLATAELVTLSAECARWAGEFCRRCGYCKPCPNGLDIPFLFLIEAYYTRYELHDWARARLAALGKRFSDCQACGQCTERCPYGLPVPELMARAAGRVR
jgi:uncharacterized protein